MRRTEGERRRKRLASGGIALFVQPFQPGLSPSFYSIMSQHPSFKSGGLSSKKKRNVLKRFERVALLRRRGKFQDGKDARVTALPKTTPDV